ncbi:WD40 repeat-like protein [Ramicandelaber brevisporus]|nr:WD40 repeat-like protein [Ramicandelaber brevisporus]
MIATGSFDATTGIWEAVGGGGRGGDRMEVDDVDLASGATGSDLGYECTAKLEGHENETKSVAWSSTGSLLATCSRDKSVWIWEAIDGDFEVLSVLQEHTQDVKMVVWHPTSDACLASASYDDTIRMWKDDEDDWYCAAVMQGHESTVWAVDFNHDGSALVSVSDDQTVMFWRPDPVAVHTSLGGYRKDPVWKCTGVIRGVHSRCIYSVSWSKQTNLVATAAGDNTICVLAPASSGLDGKSSGNVLPQETWNVVARFERPHGVHDINSIQWNPQPEYANILATAGDDGIVRVWKYIPA